MASARASEARVSSPPENVESCRSSPVSSNPSPRSRARCSLAPGPAARMLEPRLGIRVAAKRALVVGAALHRALERPELLLEREQVARAGDDVLAQREPELTRGSLVVERDPSALCEGELATLQRGLACDRAQERGLARSVRAGQRKPVTAPDGEGHALEQRISGELLAEAGCDQHGHRTTA